MMQDEAKAAAASLRKPQRMSAGRGSLLRVLSLLGCLAGLGASVIEAHLLTPGWGAALWGTQLLATFLIVLMRAMPDFCFERVPWERMILLCAWAPLGLPALALWRLARWVRTGD
jgi:hypothetical protein